MDINPNLAFNLEGMAPVVAVAVLAAVASGILGALPNRYSILAGFLGLLSGGFGGFLCWMAWRSTVRPAGALLICVVPLLTGLMASIRCGCALYARKP